jgi:formylglycine-generating enzyme required for sulfatase activity
MLGNVAEYCLDSYGTVSQNASDASAVVEDPAGPNPDLSATYVYRTLRGGGFASKASDCRSSSRVGIPMGWDASDSIYYNVGTRPEKVTKLYQGSMGVRVCLPAVAVK